MSGINRRTIRRLIELAYERGWADACGDHMDQEDNPEHPIGARKATSADAVLQWIDGLNLLGLMDKDGAR